MSEQRPARHLAGGLRGIGLSGVTVAGAAAAGVLTSMRMAYPRPPNLAPAEDRPTARAVPDDRLVVAVVLGASGSVITDALGPYEAFARSPRFLVSTVSASQPTAMLSGGLAVVPDYSLDDVEAGLASEPDVVVVPRGRPERQGGSTAARLDHPLERPGSTPAGRVQRLPAARSHGPA